MSNSTNLFLQRWKNKQDKRINNNENNWAFTAVQQSHAHVWYMYIQRLPRQSTNTAFTLENKWEKRTCCKAEKNTEHQRRRKAATDATNGRSGELFRIITTGRRQAFSCGLWHRAHVGRGGVSAPRACVHSSACTLASGLFQQTYLWVTVDAASEACQRKY